jgi:histidine ammonia-lyase
LAELRSNGDNPLFILDPASPGGGRLVNSGNFHGAALTAAVEAATVAMVHAGVLSEKRLYRLLDERASGLSRQLAHDPGLDAGAITIHKAALGYVAELKALAAPVSVMQADSSFGQEDEQSLIFPALDRLAAAVDVVGAILAHELYVAAMAIDARGERPSPTVAALHAVVRSVVPRYAGDRSYGPELDRVIELVRTRVHSTTTTA